MKVWEIQGSFGLDRLRLAERPDPAPGPGELLLAVRAVALNHRDLTTVDGTYNPKQRLPLVPCSDAAAEVVAVGEGVTRFAAGDRVCPLFAQRWLCGEPERERLRSTLGGPLDGTLAERMAVPAESAVAVPEHLSDEEAATLPCAALTAWSAVVTHGRTRPGDVVVVLGTGGVAVFALQLARLAGARVIVTSSSDDKLARARELGAWGTINYRAEPEWGRRVKELTGDRGADLVVEVGGAETLSRSLHAVRMGGTIGWILAAWPFTFIFVNWAAVDAAHPEGLVNWLGVALANRARGVLVRVLGILGGSFVFAGVCAFIALQWDAMNSAARVIVTLGPGIAALVLGVLADREARFERGTVPLLLAAAILQPTGMLVAFEEFGTGGDWRWASLTVSAVMAIQFGTLFGSLRRSTALLIAVLFLAMFWWTAFDLLDWDDAAVGLVLGGMLLLAAVGAARIGHVSRP